MFVMVQAGASTGSVACVAVEWRLSRAHLKEDCDYNYITLSSNWNANHSYKMARGLYGSNGNNLEYSISNTNIQQQGYSTSNDTHQGYRDENNRDFLASSDNNSFLQQYGPNPGYHNSYDTSSDHIGESYAPMSSRTAGVDASYSSPALSALALLGFLYFLKLIQDVLQNNGRRRRSLWPEQIHLEEEDEEYYLTSYLEKDQLSKEPSQDHHEPSTLVHQNDAEETTGQQNRLLKVYQTAPRGFSFLENFFIKLPKVLGLRSWQRVDRDGRDEEPIKMGGYITSRLKLISSIMNFLRNPSPSRVRRTVLAENQAEFVLPGKVLNTAGGDMATNKRLKRYTHTMNAWYRDLEGHNSEVSAGTGSMVEKIMLFFSRRDNLQEAVRQDDLPTLLELTRSLDGTHPHCLQRVLCHINSHSKELSFLSRVTLQLISANLVEISTSTSMTDDNYHAIEAGQQGEDCDRIFTGCNSLTSTEKK
nr:uncharacterized protein LOC123747437 [Procambarus clarkii]